MAFLSPGARRRFALNVPLSMGLAALEFGTMLLLVTFLDTAARDGDMAERFSWVGSLGVPDDRISLAVGLTVATLVLAKSILGAALSWWQLGVATRADADLSVELLGDFLAASMRFHAESDSATALRDVNLIPSSMIRTVVIPAVQLVTDLLMLLALCVLILVTSPVAGVVTLTFFGLVGGGYLAVFPNRLRDANQRDQALTHTSLARLQDGIRGAEAIQSNQAEPYFVNRFGETRDEWATNRRLSGFLVRAPRFYLESSLVIGIGLVCVLLFTTSDTTDAFAAVAVVVVVMLRLLPTLSRVVGSLNVTRGGVPAIERIEEVTFDLALASTRSDTVERQEFASDITLDGVTVIYGRVRALDDVDLRIGRGDRIAVVGTSGAGKTTLVDVLLGLQTPNAGRVLLDGVPFDAAKRAGWRQLVAYVPQDTFIVDDTLAVNVMLGIDEEDPERLQAAIAGAALDEVIATLPDGMASRLGDRGQLLSGGQRQRVGIARALYRQRCTARRGSSCWTRPPRRSTTRVNSSSPTPSLRCRVR